MIDPNNPTGAIYPDSTSPGAHRDRGTARPGDSRRRGLRRSLLRRPGRGDGGARQRRADHLLLESVEGVPRARLARGMDGRGIVAASRSGAGRDQETRRRSSVQSGADAIRGHRGAHRRSIAPGRVSQRPARARRIDHDAHERDPRHLVRDAEERVLRDAQSRTAAREDRHRLRPRPAAVEGCAHRVRLGLRHRARRRLLPHRLPRLARRAQRYLRRCLRLHRRHSDPRSVIRYACVAVAVTAVLLWTLYLVRGPLLRDLRQRALCDRARAARPHHRTPAHQASSASAACRGRWRSS